MLHRVIVGIGVVLGAAWSGWAVHGAASVPPDSAIAPGQAGVPDHVLSLISEYHFNEIERVGTAQFMGWDEMAELYLGQFLECDYSDELPGLEFLKGDETTFQLSLVQGLLGVHVGAMSKGGIRGTKDQHDQVYGVLQAGITREILMVAIPHLVLALGSNLEAIDDLARMELFQAWMTTACEYTRVASEIDHYLSICRVFVEQGVYIGELDFSDSARPDNALTIPGYEAGISLSDSPTLHALILRRNSLGPDFIAHVKKILAR